MLLPSIAKKVDPWLKANDDLVTLGLVIILIGTAFVLVKGKRIQRAGWLAWILLP
jgi:hypothetical protein